MFDLDAYLERIGLSGRPTAAEVHRAHVTHIPFENLDPRRGVPVSIDPDAIAAKLVDARRGGYCFEHNLLFKQALEALGARVVPMLARSRYGRPPELAPPLTHMVLRVEDQGGYWQMDVGYGRGTLLEPIPFGPGGPYEQSGWRFQVVSEGPLLVLQGEVAGAWRDLYAFRPEPAEPIDIAVSNWWVCTNPNSQFVGGLVAVAHNDDAVRTVLSDFSGELTLSVQVPTGSKREPVERDDVPRVLAERFGLVVD